MIDQSKSKCSIDAGKIAWGFGKELLGIGVAAFSALSIPATEGIDTPLAWGAAGTGVALAYDGYNDISAGACGR